MGAPRNTRSRSRCRGESAQQAADVPAGTRTEAVAAVAWGEQPRVRSRPLRLSGPYCVRFTALNLRADGRGQHVSRQGLHGHLSGAGNETDAAGGFALAVESLV